MILIHKKMEISLSSNPIHLLIPLITLCQIENKDFKNNNIWDSYLSYVYYLKGIRLLGQIFSFVQGPCYLYAWLRRFHQLPKRETGKKLEKKVKKTPWGRGYKGASGVCVAPLHPKIISLCTENKLGGVFNQTWIFTNFLT